MVKKASKKKIVDPNAPRKPASSYFFFLQVRRNKLKKEKPELSHNESVIYLGKEWDLLNKVQKLVFERLSEADKIRYEKECKEYLEKNPHLKNIEDDSSSESDSINVSEKKDNKKKKIKTDKIKPKREIKKKSIKSKVVKENNKTTKKSKKIKNISKSEDNKNDEINENNNLNFSKNEMQIDSTVHMNLIIESTENNDNLNKLENAECKENVIDSNFQDNNLNETIILN